MSLLTPARVVLVLAVFCFRPAAADAPPGGWSAVEEQLRSSVRQGQVQAARSAIAKLAATGESRGYSAIIEHALDGKHFPIYSYAAGAIAGSEDPRVRKEVYRAIEKSRRYRTRIILLAVAQRWAENDPAALAAIHGRLEDRSKPVVLTALERIRELNLPKASMEPLIDALERHERSRGRIYFDIQRSLRSLAGVDLEIAADWRNFWEARKNNRSVKPTGSGGRTRVASSPRFFSVAVDSHRVVFVIDTSSSMTVEDTVIEEEEEEPERFIGKGTTIVRIPPSRSKTRVVGGGGQGGSGNGEADGESGRRVYKRMRITAVKEELVRTIQSLDSSVHFNIVAFNHDLELFEPASRLVPASAGNKTKAVRWVEALRAKGLTRTDLALQQAFAMAQVDTIYLLTDGMPKKLGPRSTPDAAGRQTAVGISIPPQQVIGLVSRENRFRKCRINTIGFVQLGPSTKGFLQKLALENDGRCILLE